MTTNPAKGRWVPASCARCGGLKEDGDGNPCSWCDGTGEDPLLPAQWIEDEQK